MPQAEFDLPFALVEEGVGSVLDLKRAPPSARVAELHAVSAGCEAVKAASACRVRTSRLNAPARRSIRERALVQPDVAVDCPVRCSR